MSLDYEKLARLAREDAAEFERQRRELIEAAIAGAPPELQQRLRGLQFRIDLERQRSPNALAGCVRLNTMMWESFAKLREQLNVLCSPASGTGSPPGDPPPKPAQVIAFDRQRRDPGE